MLVEDGKSLGKLPVVDENDDSWRWQIVGTEEFLTEDMPITADLNAMAFREESSVIPEGDFIGGASGVLINQKTSNIAVNASSSGLIPCDLNGACKPDIWHFEYIGNCVADVKAKVDNNKYEYIGAGCQYYVVNDDGIYLKINNGSVGVSSSPVATLVRLHSNGNYTFNNGGGADSRFTGPGL